MLAISKEIMEEMRGWIEDVWILERDWRTPGGQELNVYRVPPGIELWKAEGRVLQAALIESIERLRRKFTPDDLKQAAADLYFHPLDWLKIDKEHPGWSIDQYEQAMFYVLETLVVLYPAEDLVQRIEERISTILQHPYTGSEIGIRSWPPKNHYPPTITDCTRLFLNLPPSAATLDYARRFLLGEFNAEVVHDPGVQPVSFEKAYQIYRREMPALRLLEYLHLHGSLEYELFCQALIESSKALLSMNASSCIDDLSFLLPGYADRHPANLHRESPYASRFLEAAETFLDRFVEEHFQNLNHENYRYLRYVHNLRGSHWLLRAAQVHRDFKLKKLQVDVRGQPHYSSREGIDTLVIHLARVQDIVPAEPPDQRALVEELKTFPRSTLKYILPITADDVRTLILRALGWERAQPLIDFILELGRHKFDDFKSDIPNSSDPNSGVVDLQRYRSVVELAGMELAWEILVLFHDAGIDLTNTITLLRAALGDSREKIEKQIRHRYQVALKAYGLLPLQRGPEEVLERYRFIQQFKRESKKFGAERQATERGAVQTALANLAQVAGYADIMRLEWDMEARLSAEVIAVGKQWKIGDVEVTLRLRGADPELGFSRGDKALKTVPKSVRESDEYVDIRNHVNELRTQARRFRDFFEEMMTLNQVLTRDDLHLLDKMPVPSFLLSQLILQTADGELGLYVPGEVAVETLDGRRQPVREAAFLAHPYHLQMAGQLGDWQRLLVHRRMVQPFKQAFRELYTITPAELETGNYSNRFAGFVVDGGKVYRLFQARKWEFEGNITPCKTFREFGFQALFRFPEVTQYWGSDIHPTSDCILFRRYPMTPQYYRDHPEDRYLSLTQIPPTIFSEVMRDADLVVSVAAVSDGELVSREVIRNKVEVVQALLDDLQLTGVTFDDNFAYVQGKLAKYRVHMASAVIHIEPGSYLCIVPANWGKKHRDVFLPFSDLGDDKISEVISKIFLLLGDDKIKDESILRQIKSHTG